MAVSNSFLEQFLNELAAQMQEGPAPDLSEMQQRVLGDRARLNRLNRTRDLTVGANSDITSLLGSLVDPRPFLEGALWSATHPRERLTGEGMNSRMEFPIGKGAGHGAQVRAEVLAKRKAKGPRKGSGQPRKPKYPPETNQDLVEMLAQSLPVETAVRHKPKGGGLRAMLGRLRRAE